MITNPVNQVAFVRTSREFPPDLYELGREMNRGWIELANAINSRIIGIFPTTRPAQTGESWFISKNQRQQSLREVYTFTSVATPIPHNLNFNQISGFSRMWGQFTDGTNWYGLIPASNVAIAGQISFYLTPTNITFLTGAGAPTLTNGLIVLEWLSQV